MFQKPEDIEAELVSMNEVMEEDELNLVVSIGSSREIFNTAIIEKWGTREFIVELNRRMNNPCKFH